MYGDNDWPQKHDSRPLSFAPSAQERALERKASRFSSSSNSSADTTLSRTLSSERHPGNPNGAAMENKRRKSSLGNTQERMSPSPPDLTRSPSADTANQHFPLNDIDYESSPAAVAQELSNLQAIRRMSMNVDAADPDLPSFNSGIGMPSVAPSHSADENDTSRLFWVPARLHPELAPKDYKTFVEDRVDRIKRRSGDDDPAVERSASASSLRRNESLGRRKSMLSKAVETPGDLKDGAEVLERKRSRGHSRTTSAETSLHELESLVNDPTSLMRNMSLDTRRRSSESNDDHENEDIPILPTPAGQTLKRSTRTTYRRGSLRKGERLPPSRRATGRGTDGDPDRNHHDFEVPSVPPIPNSLSRVRTEPTPHPQHPSADASDNKSHKVAKARESRPLQPSTSLEDMRHEDANRQSLEERRPQPRAFHSRIARNGRTTAPLPGYHPHHSVPQITETPPPEARLSLPPISQTLPERKSSHEFLRANSLPTSARSTARSALGKQQKNSNQSLEDMANNPSAMPGTSTSTDGLSFIPTFADDRKDKPEKKQKDRKERDFGDSGYRKTGWGWLLGSDEKDKDKEREKEDKHKDKEGKKERGKEEKKDERDSKKAKSKLSTKPTDRAHDSTRLDVLQTVTDGPKGRESIVVDRDNLRLEEERKKERTRSKQDVGEKKEKETSIFSSLFGGGKKHKADRDGGGGNNKKHRAEMGRGLSPEPRRRTLRADIDYNWTRFSILEERAIYRMAHIKLANPRRALYSQVLLSNFMYSYLAKVQQMHPQIQIPAFVNQKGNQRRQSEEQSRQSDEFQQWQAYQEVSRRYCRSDSLKPLPIPYGGRDRTLALAAQETDGKTAPRRRRRRRKPRRAPNGRHRLCPLRWPLH